MSEHRELYGKELDPKVLSNLILIKRTDRPDEWGMDELSRKAFELEKENAELKKERGELVRRWDKLLRWSKGNE